MHNRRDTAQGIATKTMTTWYLLKATQERWTSREAARKQHAIEMPSERLQKHEQDNANLAPKKESAFVA